MLTEGYIQSEIGKVIGKSKSVISREIERNKDQRSGEYRHDLAQKKYCTRKAAIPKYSRFTDEVKAAIELLLNDDYSPEQIVGTLCKQGRVCVSHETIYQHIWDDKNKMETYTHTSCEGKDEAIENEATVRTLGVL